RGTVIRLQPTAPRRATTARPTKPAPPVTSTDLRSQKPMRLHSVEGYAESSTLGLMTRSASRPVEAEDPARRVVELSRKDEPGRAALHRHDRLARRRPEGRVVGEQPVSVIPARHHRDRLRAP